MKTPTYVQTFAVPIKLEKMQRKLELKDIPFQSNRCTLALQMTCFKLLLLKRMVSISSLCHTFNSFATPRRVPAKYL